MSGIQEPPTQNHGVQRGPSRKGEHNIPLEPTAHTQHTSTEKQRSSYSEQKFFTPMSTKHQPTGDTEDLDRNLAAARENASRLGILQQFEAMQKAHSASMDRNDRLLSENTVSYTHLRAHET